jgi:hypothetical protein
MNATEGFKDHPAAAQETEALIRNMLAKGRSLQVIVATSAWSLFEVRQIATADGYDFTKDGAPFKPAPKLTRGRHPAEAAAHPIDEERTRPAAFVPSATPDPDPPNCHVQVMPGLHPEPEHPATTTTAAPRLAADTEEAATMVDHTTVTMTLELDYMKLVRAIKDGLESADPKVKRLAEKARDAGGNLVQYLDQAAARAAAVADVERLRRELADAERRLRGDRPPPVAHATPSHRPERNRAIRAWAAEQGLAVGKVGRVRADVVQAYREAHPDEGAP